MTDRVKFIQTEKLCFSCLKPGHHSKGCNNRSVCKKCNKRHPTCLHEERGKEEQKTPQDRTNQNNQAQIQEVTTTATTNRVICPEGNTQTAAIIPVGLSSITQPAKEVLVYALLDSQRDTTFVLSEVAESLDTTKEPVTV